MRRPDAEHDVDAALVAKLVADQHPDLECEVTFLAEGWDTTSWRLGEALLARLPRRQQAVGGLVAEQRWLPLLAPTLPLPVPAPCRIGVPGRGFPWPWSVVPYLPGVPALEAPIDGPRVAVALGGFLRALHAAAPSDAPTSAVRGVPVASRADHLRALADELDPVVDVGVARRALERGLAASPSAEAVWVHGDPHPGNLLVEDGALVGVLDFNDLNAGDPATDLAGLWLALEPDDTETALHAYGAADADLVARARAWAALFALLFVAIGLEDDADFGRLGRVALGRLAASEP